MLLFPAIISFIFATSANGANILVIPDYFKSNTKSMLPLAEKLAQSGHFVVLFQNPIDSSQRAKLSPKSKIQDRVSIIPSLTPRKEENQPFRIPSDVIWKNPSIGGFVMWFYWYVASLCTKKIFEVDKSKTRFV